jgi:putative acetyltransferase
MLIRDEDPADRAAIAAVTTAAFKQPAEAKLVEALRASGDAVISLVAESGDTIVGHVMLSQMASPAHTLGLAPVSVDPAHQNRGVGHKLITLALERARRDGWDAVFVLGDPAYYTRFGFRVDAAAKFDTPYPKDHMMALALTPGALDSLSGAIAYAPAFSAFE